MRTQPAPNGTWAWAGPLPSSVVPLHPEASAVLSHWYCRRFDGSLPPGLSASAHDPRTDCLTPSTAPEEALIKAQWVSDSAWAAGMKEGGSAEHGLDWWRALHERAKAGELDDWKTSSPWENLALVLLLDQVPRALFDGPEILCSDEKALATTLSAIKRGMDLQLPPAWRLFFYFPLMHAENVPDQELGVSCITALAEAAPGFGVVVKSAVAHLEPVQLFGRLPERNEMLSRPSSEAEVQYLKDHPTA